MEKSRLSTSLAQLRALKQELAHQAYHDSLTGLANRALFRDRVDAALADAAATTAARSRCCSSTSTTSRP